MFNPWFNLPSRIRTLKRILILAYIGWFGWMFFGDAIKRRARASAWYRRLRDLRGRKAETAPEPPPGGPTVN